MPAALQMKNLVGHETRFLAEWISRANSEHDGLTTKGDNRISGLGHCFSRYETRLTISVMNGAYGWPHGQ